MSEGTWAGRAQLARAWLLRQSGSLPFDPEQAHVEPIPNWGGFVNASYRVTSAGRRWHLKLAAVGDSAGLRRWSAVHERLSARYRAPPMVASASVTETGGWGALFEHVDGIGMRGADAGVLVDVLRVLGALHADGALANALTATAAPGVPECLCAEHYFDNLDHRFRADLASIPADLPCLASRDHDWMWDEVEMLAKHVREAAAFHVPTRAPVHGDLWADNLLAAEDGSWHVVDWDDLRIGDPVLDYATVLGPAPHDLTPVDESRLPGGVDLDAAARERARTYARATLLDWVIDPLADWVDADVAGAEAPRFRAEKERLHREAKALYRARWG